MKVRVRFGPRDIRHVYCVDSRCPTLDCFWLTTHVIHSSVGASGCGSCNTEDWCCGTNDQRGCPPAAERRVGTGEWTKRGGIWAKAKETDHE